MTTIKSFEIPYTDQDVADVEIHVQGGRVVAFSINYRARIEGRWLEVVRYDTFHGPPHKHRFWRAPGEEREALAHASNRALGVLLVEATVDLEANWLRYRLLMEERA